MSRAFEYAALLLSFTFAGCGGFGGAGVSLPAMGSTSAGSTAAAPTGWPSTVQLKQLVIETDGLGISQPGFGQQLQASGLCSDGRVRDLTHFVTWTTGNQAVVSVDANGVAHAQGAGTTTVTATTHGFTAQANVDVAASAIGSGTTATPSAPSGPTWHTDIFPLFASALTCKSCHTTGGIGTGTGIMVLSGVETTDYTTMTTKGLLDMANPANSRLIQKGTGAIAHGGGAAMAPGSPEATKIQQWIAAGAPQQAASPSTPPPTAALPVPDALIVNPPVRNLIDPSAQQQMTVLAWYGAAGTTIDVTQLATWTWSASGIASCDSSALVKASSTGTVTLTAYFEGVLAQAQLAFGPSAVLSGGDSPAPIKLPAKGAVLSGAPKLSLISGNGQTGVPGTMLPAPLVVAVTDVGGKPVANVPVTFAPGSGGATVTAANGTTDATGHAQTTIVLGTAGTNTVMASGAGALATSPVTFNEMSQPIIPPTLSIVSGNNATGTTGAAVAPFVVALKDSAGKAVAATAVTFAISSSGGGSLSVMSISTDANGQAATTLTLPGTPGTTTVTATASGATGSPVTFTATAKAPTLAVVSGNNQTGLTGAALAPFIVSVVDANNRPLANQTISFSITTGQGSLSAPSATSGTDGRATVTLTLPAAAGTTVVTASLPGATGSPILFTAVAKAPVFAIVSGNNQSATVGTLLAPFVVSVADGNNAPLAKVTVSFTIASGLGTLSAPNATTGANGQAQVTLTLAATPGTTVVTASYPGASGSPGIFTATAVVGAPASVVVVSGTPQAAVAGSVLQPFVAAVKDAKGNLLAGQPVTFTISSGSGTLSTGSTATATNGQASTMLSLPATAGTTVVTGAVPGLMTVATFTATATAAAPPTIAIVSGSGQTGLTGAKLAAPLVVLVKSGAGTPVVNGTVTFAASNGGVLSATSVATDATGQASVMLTLGAAGSNNVTASFAGASSATFTETATGLPTIAIVSGDAQTGTVGAALAAPLVVVVKDGAGLVVANAKVTFAVASGGGSVNPASATTNASGQAQTALTLGAAAGTNTVTASYTGATPVTFTETGALPTLSIVTGNNQTGTIGTALGSPLVVLVKDGAGNPMANATVTFAVTSGGGTVTPATATTGATGQAQTALALGAAAGTNTVTASSPNTTPVTFTETGAAAAALSWATDVHPLFSGRPGCAGCHDAAGPGRMKLTGNAANDYAAIVGNTTAPLVVDRASPASSYLIEKAAGVVGHGGGSVWPTTSTQYQKVLTWIQQGAKP